MVVYNSGKPDSVPLGGFQELGSRAGNLADPVIGAPLERQHRIGNNGVNLLNTAGGALVAGILAGLA